jgi:hypothetical protein
MLSGLLPLSIAKKAGQDARLTSSFLNDWLTFHSFKTIYTTIPP